jgi:hypothetical protein
MLRDFDALVKRWDMCISVDGGYVEKINVSFWVRISHAYVLYLFMTYLLTLLHLSFIPY